MAKEGKSWFLKHPIFSVFLLIFVLGLFMGFIGELTGNIKEEETKKTAELTESQAEQKVDEYLESQKELSCLDECTSSGCDGKEYFVCLTQSDGCKDKIGQGWVVGECGVECLMDSHCKNIEKCESFKCVEKKSDTLTSLEILQEKLEEYNERTLKLDECTKACAGEYYNIPAVRDEFYMTCYEVYYNLGAKGVDKLISQCRKPKTQE